MPEKSLQSKASVAGHPIHPMLVPIPIACFVGTFFTDLVYVRTYDMQWASMSSWLLTIGLVVALFGAIAGMIDFFGIPRVRDLRAGWIHVFGNALALVLSIANALVHTREAYSSVYPTGIILSCIVVLILLVTAWTGG